MNVEQALLILTKSTPENHKYFKDQIGHFKIDSQSALKDYLDTINTNTLEWLRTLPENVKGKSTFHKYKAPIYELLMNTSIKEAYGEVFCATLTKQIRNVFKDNIDNIIQERKQTNNIVIDDDNTDVSNDSDIDSNHESDIIDTDTHKHIHNINQTKNIDYKEAYDSLLTQYDRLKIKHDCAKEELTRVWKFMYNSKPLS